MHEHAHGGKRAPHFHPTILSRFIAQDEGSKLVETAGSRFVDECKQLYAAERYADVLDRFAAQLGVLFSKAGSDQGGCEAVCRLAARHLCFLASPAQCTPRRTLGLRGPSRVSLQPRDRAFLFPCS